uniref:Hydrogenase 2 operon protein HybA n=1 Tax=Eiseniibacteriota bacterium TaxID=2212470 RepID=A0A832IBL9_UNCEI
MPDRRSVLQALAASGAAVAAAALPAAAKRAPSAPPGAMGMLYDTTRCIGCKACVTACNVENGLEADRSGTPEGVHLAPTDLNGRTKNVIKLYRDGEQMSFFKAQCMHCVEPACASACMLHSLHKNETTGVVEYDASYCVGCRYCIMACAFNVPKFQFDRRAPRIVKCELCRHRVKDAAVTGADGFTRYPRGQGPACCEVCPRGAVIYGRRDELLAEAKRRIAASPGKYFEDRVYGETEGGGTQVLYLSHVPFARLGLPTLGPQAVPDVANAVQQGIYRGFIAPLALYGVLAGVILRHRRAGGAREEERP